MSYGVYIGDPDDPDFRWSGGNWDGNIPRRIGPLFPPPAPISALWSLIDRGELPGAQVDWGGWAARAAPPRIAAFIDENYPADWREAKRELPHLLDQLRELQAAVEKLDPAREYLLVAFEQ